MYALDKDNVREVTEKCLAGSEFERHGLYALHFMTENIHTSIWIDDPYTTEGKEGISSGLYQKLTGESPYFLGFVDLNEGLTAIARGFAGDEFEDDMEFIRDATGEFINRINGEYVIASSKSDMLLDMEPQLFLEEEEVASIIKPLSTLHIPVKIGDSEAEMLFVKMKP